VGVHLVAVQRGGAPEERLVTVAADETREVLPDEASAEHDATVPKGLPETVTNDQTAGLSPLWFVVGAATTVGLGVATIASAVDTLNDHGRFESFGCESSSAPGCAGLAATGRGAQTRTTWLAIGSGAALAGTAALGIFGVRWHRGGGGTVSAHLAGTTTALRVTF
jgi:hypothetical protein